MFHGGKSIARTSIALVFVAVLVLGGCSGGDEAAPPPSTDPGSSSGQPITGNERIGWEQRAADSVELALFGYAIYIDGVRTVASSVSCASTPTATGFACSAAMPRMQPGTHTLTIAAFVNDGALLESPQSAALRVTLGTTAARSAPAAERSIVTTADGVSLAVDPVVEGLDGVSDLALAPDGRLFVADASGLWVVRERETPRQPALAIDRDQAILAVALDPEFVRNRFVYAIGAAPDADGHPTFWLARFAEAAEILVDRIVLLDGIPASTGSPAAALRFGPDGKLYASFDTGDDPSRAGDLASSNGKILRLNTDGTTPRDQTPPTPVFAQPFLSPHGLDWDPRSGTLWLADGGTADTARLHAIVTDSSGGSKRARVQTVYALAPLTAPSSLAFYRGGSVQEFQDSAFLASKSERHLLRVRIDPADPTRVRSTERLLQDALGGIRVVAAGIEGALYIATEDSIYRLTAVKAVRVQGGR